MSIIIISPTILLLYMILSSSCYNPIVSDSDSCYMHQYLKHTTADQKFNQKTTRFWQFSEQSNSWIEVQLPYHLLSCTGDNCTVVDSIQQPVKKREDDDGGEKNWYPALAVRKRISLTKMSETSVWVTGESGSIYERFWNGLQWVIAPHELPVSAGYAVSVFIVNQTILALSQAGLLYQMQLTEESQPIWVEFMPEFDKDTSKDTVRKPAVQLSFGVVSNVRERMYFCTKDGLLLELVGVDLPRWENHGRPPGADVAAVTDAAAIRAGLLLIVSAAGDLYEYDQMTKPPWKKHVRRKDTSLASISACFLHGLMGTHSLSLFLLTKGGELIERRLHQRKWTWVLHGNPKGHELTSITCISQDQNSNSLFVTTASGFVFEYHIQKYLDVEEKWVNHEHPPHAKVARGIAGLQLQAGRTIFALDDGRLAELHLSGIGGESVGPNAPISTRRKSVVKYVWSLLDAPETEGWNAEYCTEQRGPSNCILGTKEETNEGPSISRWRKDSKTQQNYLSPPIVIDDSLPGSEADKLNSEFFRLRLMQGGNSFFHITDNLVMFEYLHTKNAWFWLRHEHSTGIQGVVGNYNGSLFVVDEHGSLLIRERSSSDLAWINCTAMRKSRQVIGGPPWDSIPGQPLRAKSEDAIFFVSRTGTLLEFTVALRKFKWKDCKNPPGIKVASIVDQEGFRENIVFVVGKNGRLYQYNKVTQLWHQHYQSQHLVLSASPGTATRPSPTSLRGSLFMLSEDGGLVEYQWSPMEGWNWIEHGTPHTNATLVGAPGPCFDGSHLFLVGSDGSVYLRFSDKGEWKWNNCGFPCATHKVEDGDGAGNSEYMDTNFANIKEKFNKHCNPKVSSTRPIPFSDNSIIFELQDGRVSSSIDPSLVNILRSANKNLWQLAEMKHVDAENWVWSRTIATPTSLCMPNF